MLPAHGALVVLALGLAPVGSRAAEQSCAPRLLAETPLRDDMGFLSTPVSVNGRTVSLVVDTGSEGSLISPDYAREMELPTDPLRSTRLAGPGGDGGVAPNVIARSLRIGGLELGPVSLPMGFLPARPNIHPPVEGLLGGDLLSGDGAVLWHPPVVAPAGGGRVDALELDAPSGRMAFWTAGAAEACDQPPRVEGGWASLPATRRGRRIVLKIRLDGHDLTALLDSGARSRIVSQEAAAALGVSKDALERDPGGTTAGVDGRASIYRWHRFHSLTIGGETELNPVLTVARVSEPVDMLLGSDWFAQRRVWISYREGRVFVVNLRKASSGR
ncbi:hypothetical protein HK28_10715 [Acetobacter sp. DsW_063]|nr:hypothetical protein HK28_10715 [Acetobacter sp. DsW_063]